MCVRLLIGLGGLLQVAGIALLIHAILETGRTFDEGFGIARTIEQTHLGAWWRRKMPRWLGGRKGEPPAAKGVFDANDEVTSMLARGRARPPWPDLEPIEAVRKLDELLSAEVDQLHWRFDQEAAR